MKPIVVMTDSHSSISEAKAKELGIIVLPMPFTIDGVDIYEDDSLDKEELLQKIKNGSVVSTAQPSPADLTDAWDKALTEYEKIIYIPISKGLSGGYQTACMLASEEEYEGKVFVIDAGRVSVVEHRTILDILELIADGYQPEDIRTIIERSNADMNIYVAVSSLDNLRKGGRISSTTAALGTLLNIKPVLQFSIGTLDMYKKCRGMAAAKKAMIEAIKNDIETKYKDRFEKGEVYILAATSVNDEETAEWVKEIKEAFCGIEVMADKLSVAVSCHIGYGGLGIGFSCKPDRSVVNK